MKKFRRKNKNTSIYQDEEKDILEESNSYYHKKKKKINKKWFFKTLYSYLIIIIILFIIIIAEAIFLINIYSSKKNNKNISLLNNRVFNYNATNYSYLEEKFSLNNNQTNKSNINNINNIIGKNSSKNLTEEKINRKKKEELLRKKAIESGIKYLEKCHNGKLINNRTINIINGPKISVVIPVYNCKDTIEESIRSIQNQDMIDIEIVLVEDSSTDRNATVQKIEKMKSEDNRIKIIYNNRNMGTLYSRCIGALMAKGKYITTLDNDDMFLDRDVFDTLYEEAEKGNFDIISFKVIEGRNWNNINQIKDNYLIDKENNLIIRQPELGINPIVKNNSLYPNDIYIWGKIIISGVYKAAVNVLGREKFSNYIVWVEDTSIFFIICNIAESYKFITKYGLFHYLGSTASIRESNENRMIAEIFLLDIIFDFSKNSDKKYAAYKLMAIRDYPFFKYESPKVKSNLKLVVKKIMNCDYIEENLKEKIKLKYSGLDVFPSPKVLIENKTNNTNI